MQRFSLKTVSILTLISIFCFSCGDKMEEIQEMEMLVGAEPKPQKEKTLSDEDFEKLEEALLNAKSVFENLSEVSKNDAVGVSNGEFAELDEIESHLASLSEMFELLKNQLRPKPADAEWLRTELKNIFNTIEATLENYLTKVENSEEKEVEEEVEEPVVEEVEEEIQIEDFKSVDLGLSVKWATCNLGAENPEDFGSYYAWGELKGFNEGKTVFNWDTYKYGDEDVVSRKTAGKWRMPTKKEQDELREKCFWQWVNSYNGKEVNGYVVFKAKYVNGKKDTWATNYDYQKEAHIFLPAAGYRFNGELYQAQLYPINFSYGYYWSSTLLNSENAYYLSFQSREVGYLYNDRSRGYSIRAVCELD